MNLQISYREAHQVSESVQKNVVVHNLKGSTRTESFFESKLHLMSFTNFSRAVSGLWFILKPIWCFSKIPFFCSKSQFSWIKICFSITLLEKKLLFFRRGLTTAVLKCSRENTCLERAVQWSKAGPQKKNPLFLSSSSSRSCCLHACKLLKTVSLGTFCSWSNASVLQKTESVTEFQLQWKAVPCLRYG